MAFDKSGLDDYVDVAARIAEFRAKHPEGSLQPADPSQPFRIETIGDKTYVVVVAAAYRSPDDVRPGIGMAYEPWPGRTPYTRDSELMNAETSAWGRAIVAVLASDSKRIASAEDVRNRQADREHVEPVWDAAKLRTIEAAIEAAKTEPELKAAWEMLPAAVDAREISVEDAQRLSERVKEKRAALAAEPAQAEPAAMPEQQTIPLPSDGQPATDKQKRRMYATFRELGIAGADQHEFMSRVTGRTIASSNDLTTADAESVIIALDQQKQGVGVAN